MLCSRIILSGGVLPSPSDTVSNDFTRYHAWTLDGTAVATTGGGGFLK